ncbi:MAG TPA: tRNA epoxyqueuosine(34) reductase QueG [Candidatus Acidoferrum sp.]|nr:tRNA epoxyqueuosine(34) reductase QueG [Candidatus Acidoferrum sp.]
MKPRADSVWIVDQAKSLGFDLAGVVGAEKFPELAQTPEWLARGYAGEMKYLTDPRRGDPQTAMPGIRSVIVCLLNYNTERPFSTNPALPRDAHNPSGWISRYAWGDDYHDVLRERLDAFAGSLREHFTEPFETRTYVDTGPVQERVLAKYAGLGWLGKNTLLLNQMLGSLFFLGVVLTTLDLEPTLAADELPPPDLCGSCRRCLDACPTQAFVEPYVMDARKCISYLTIELRGPIPEEFREPMGNHIFGCDICQDVCPWNRRAPIATIPQFQPRVFSPQENEESDTEAPRQQGSFYLPRLDWLLGLSEAEFRELFRGSPVKRTKWRGLMRNACIALGNSGLQRGMASYGRFRGLLERLMASEDQVIAESARWALSRIQ